MKRIKIIMVITVAFGVLAFLLLAALGEKPEKSINGDEIIRAVQQFSSAHRPLPATATFSQLISGGYLRSNVLKEFGASEITVNLNATDTNPQMFLMNALMPDGTYCLLLSDGSVQGYTRSKFQEAMSNSVAAPESPRP